jgi:hypothetical protein
MVYDSAGLKGASAAFIAAQPRKPFLSSGVGEPQQQIAMTRSRRTPTDQVFAAQFVERLNKVVPSAQPSGIAGDESLTVADERVMPFALCNAVLGTGAADVHGTGRNMLQYPDVQHGRHGELSHGRRIDELPLRLANDPVRHARSPLGDARQGSGNGRRESIALVSRNRHGRNRYRSGLVGA